MTNNAAIKALGEKIYEIEANLKYTENDYDKLVLNERLLELRTQYTPLLLKKRTMLLIFGIAFAIFYGISLCICLPPYIIRGKKRDINEKKIIEIKQEIVCLKKKLEMM